VIERKELDESLVEELRMPELAGRGRAEIFVIKGEE